MTFSPGPCQRQSNTPIQLDTLLVAEGRDTFEFAVALLTRLGLQNQIEVRDGGGVGKRGTGDFEQYIQLLPAISGFHKVSSMGMIRDADADPARAFQDACKALTRAGLPVPPAVPQPSPPTPKVTVMLLPDARSSGMLKTLYWRTLAGDPRVTCTEEFLACVARETGQPIARMDKSRVYAYIAAREEPWLLLGQAARAGYFPWDSAEFAEIKQFLQGLIPSVP